MTKTTTGALPREWVGPRSPPTVRAQGYLGCAGWMYSASLSAFAASRCAVAVEEFCQVAPRASAWNINHFSDFYFQTFWMSFGMNLRCSIFKKRRLFLCFVFVFVFFL